MMDSQDGLIGDRRAQAPNHGGLWAVLGCTAVILILVYDKVDEMTNVESNITTTESPHALPEPTTAFAFALVVALILLSAALASGYSQNVDTEQLRRGV